MFAQQENLDSHWTHGLIDRAYGSRRRLHQCLQGLQNCWELRLNKSEVAAGYEASVENPGHLVFSRFVSGRYLRTKDGSVPVIYSLCASFWKLVKVNAHVHRILEIRFPEHLSHGTFHPPMRCFLLRSFGACCDPDHRCLGGAIQK